MGTSQWLGVTTGAFHTCGIQVTGSLWCWGDNDYGQLGTGISGNVEAPEQVGRHQDWTLVAAGQYHTCALRSAMRLMCWGDNGSGQLGTGDQANR